MYKASTVAAYVVWFYNQHNKTINNIKLHKILYFLQAEFLVGKGTPCFSDEIEAWETGPVVPDVYREYKKFGNSAIPVMFTGPFNITVEDEIMIVNILKTSFKFSTFDLMCLSQNQTPWIRAYNRPGNNRTIYNNSIVEFFKNKEK